MLGQDALETILGIEEPVTTDPEAMARELRMTTFPLDLDQASERERAFAERMAGIFEDLGVEMVPFEETLTGPPLDRAFRWLKKGTIKTLKDPLRVFRSNGESYEEVSTPGLRVLMNMRWGEKIEPGTSVLSAGDGKTGNLPVDYMSDFRDVTILTVIDQPEDVEEDMPFTDHYETAIELFCYYMTNVVVGVGDDQWFIYNFNGSHPFYDLDADLEQQLLESLIPKLAAPIRPPKLSEFDIREEAFDPTDAEHAPIVDEIVASGALLETSDLYPPGMSLDDIPWRNAFYHWAQKIHLDERTGMSYGFLARQMPTETRSVVPADEAGDALGIEAPPAGQLQRVDDELVATLDTPEGLLTLTVPPVYAMTLRSGCDKTNPDPETDLVKLGLEHGQMLLETPAGTRIEEGYRPSFDTKVILAHSVGNAIVASVLDHLQEDAWFPRHLTDEGMALAHWHGYLNPEHVPEGWHVHGADEPPVSCGTPQAGLFALDGKLTAFQRALSEGDEFRGDVHIEPQHGTNLTFPTLEEVGRFLTKGEDVAGLGNRYLDAYKDEVKARATA